MKRIERFSHRLCLIEFSTGPFPTAVSAKPVQREVPWPGLLFLLFRMTILYFPLECVKVNKTHAASIYGREFRVGFFFSSAGGSSREDRVKKGSGSQFCVRFLLALHVLSLYHLLSRTCAQYQDAAQSPQASGGLPVPGRISTALMHFKRC